MTNKKTNMYLCQFSDMFGDEIYLPYSVGMVWSYARTFPEINDNIENAGFVFVREDPSLIVSRMENPGIAAFSTYVWNWEMSVAVAKEIKEHYPECLIIFGGYQAPESDRLGNFFEEYPYIDIIVHGEGEVTFAEILREYITTRNYTAVEGLTYRGITTPRRERVKELDTLPSPYLTGVFDELFELPYKYHTVWESNRGCPYGCTFCDWGSAALQKLYRFSEDRLYEEIDFFGEKKISYVYLADANFGILPRDIQIAEYIAEVKARTGGYPDKLRTNYAKNNADRVHQIARILNKEQLDKGITLSVQSMDDQVLDIIKRKNLKYDTISSFIKQYAREGIYTYTELIIGLPGETYESYCKGVEKLLEASAHDSLYMYRCILLPNAPMADRLYRSMHKIKTVKTPFPQEHALPGLDPVTEYTDTIVETATLSHEDYKRTLIISWAIQTFHALNLTQLFAIYANAYEGFKYVDFYQRLIEFAEQHPETVLGEELKFTRQKFDDALEKGGDWYNVVPEFQKISWPMEEASYLRIGLRRDQFYEELLTFLDELESTGELSIEPSLRDDLLAYQKALVVKWEKDAGATLNLSHSVHSFYRAVMTGTDGELRKGRYQVRVTDPYGFNGDMRRYSTEIVFWGRRSGRSSYRTVEEVEIVNEAPPKTAESALASPVA